MNTRLDLWIRQSTLGRKPRTAHFYRECAETVRPQLAGRQDLDTAAVLDIGEHLSHYCPARWNCFVSILRFLSTAATCLPRRPIRLQPFNPPDQAHFDALLAELDHAPRSKAGLIARFLSVTGLRISERKWRLIGSSRQA